MSSYFRSGPDPHETIAEARLRAWQLANNLIPPAGALHREPRRRSQLPDVGPDQIVRVPRRGFLAGLAALFGRGAAGAIATGLSGEEASRLGSGPTPPYLGDGTENKGTSAPTQSERIAA